MPKGDINQLWQLLGIDMYPDEVILQEYNPYKDYPFPRDFVFIDEGLAAYGTPEPFNAEEPLSAGMKQVLTVRPGAIRQEEDSKLEFVPLAVTGTLTATVPYNVLERIQNTADIPLEQVTTKESYILSALVEGEYENTEDLEGGLDVGEGQNAADEGEAKPKGPVEKTPIKAVVVSDIDCLADAFFEIRARGEQDIPNFSDLDFQNVAYVLNTLDYLAADDRFMDIRKRTRPHRVLTKIEEATKQSREEFREVIDEARQEIDDRKREAQQDFAQKIESIRNNSKLSEQEKLVRVAQEQERGSRKLQREIDRMDKELEREITQTQRKLEKVVRGVQDRYKFFAFVLPPILPILLGILVYFHRRQAEREGVSKSRLRYNQDQDKAA
jgi:ABC-2 type transport system permease protein